MSLRLPRTLIPRLPRLATALAWLLALAVCGWILAGRFWEAAAPKPVLLPMTEFTDPLATARGVAAAHLFGAPLPGSGNATARGPYHLLGTMTGDGQRPGFAILATEGKPPLPVVEGESLAPGLILGRVLPRAVELDRQGVKERLELSPATQGSKP